MNLREIVKDYELNFDGKFCTIFTNYKNFPKFTVAFDVKDLYHLLGIHKLQTGLYASSWIKAIKEDSFDLTRYKNHPDFRMIRPRINNYGFFYEIFYLDNVQICILDKDLSKNTMRLSVVFYKEHKRQVVVVGLRRDKTGYFRPVTLHESRNNPYRSVRKTIIKKVEWLD